mgnify:CR=1 FL=1
MENLIDKFRNIFNEIKSDKGDFYLFMVLKMDEYIDKWSVIASAPWISRDNPRESFDYVAGIIKKNLNSEEISTIARLGIFQPDEHLVQLITASIRVQDGSNVKLENTQVNGYKIHEGYVFESKQPETQGR